MEPAYKIAVLGYGSLPNHIHSDIYNKTLNVAKPNSEAAVSEGTNLKPDSPFAPAATLKLPLRLGRISNEGTDRCRVTMVLCKGASEEPVFYARSTMSSLDSAIKNLREMEGISSQNYQSIGYVNLSKGTSRSRIPEVADKIKRWALENHFDAVVWTDLPTKGIEFSANSTGREIEPLLTRDPLLLANTQKYIADLAGLPNALQKRILNMPVESAASSVPAAAILQNHYQESLTADFAERAKPENQTHTPKSEWFNKRRWGSAGGDDWGPFALAYPKPRIPNDVDPIQWKRDRVIESALYWIKKGIPYSSKTAYKVGQLLPHSEEPRFMLRGHFPARNCGLDCSNFAAWVYNFALGVQFSSAVNDLVPVKKDDNGRIIRDSSGRPVINERKMLSEPGAGKIIHSNGQLMKGDLLLYSGAPKHVAIYLDENHVLESTSAGQGVARIVDLRDPEYAYLRPKTSNARYLFARRPIE